MTAGAPTLKEINMNKGIYNLLKTYNNKMNIFKGDTNKVFDWLIANEGYFALQQAIIEMNEYNEYFDENGKIKQY